MHFERTILLFKFVEDILFPKTWSHKECIFQQKYGMLMIPQTLCYVIHFHKQRVLRRVSCIGVEDFFFVSDYLPLNFECLEEVQKCFMQLLLYKHNVGQRQDNAFLEFSKFSFWNDWRWEDFFKTDDTLFKVFSFKKFDGFVVLWKEVGLALLALFDSVWLIWVWRWSEVYLLHPKFLIKL